MKTPKKTPQKTIAVCARFTPRELKHMKAETFVPDNAGAVSAFVRKRLKR